MQGNEREREGKGKGRIRKGEVQERGQKEMKKGEGYDTRRNGKGRGISCASFWLNRLRHLLGYYRAPF